LGPQTGYAHGHALIGGALVAGPVGAVVGGAIGIATGSKKEVAIAPCGFTVETPRGVYAVTCVARATDVKVCVLLRVGDRTNTELNVTPGLTTLWNPTGKQYGHRWGCDVVRVR